MKFHIIKDVEVGNDIMSEDTYNISSAMYRKDNTNYNIGRYLDERISSFCNLRSRDKFMSDRVYCDFEKINLSDR